MDFGVVVSDAGDGGAAAGVEDGAAGGEGEVDAGGVGYGGGLVGEGAVEEGGVLLGRLGLGGGGLEAVGGDGGVRVESWVGGAVGGHCCSVVGQWGVFLYIGRARRLEKRCQARSQSNVDVSKLNIG